MMTKLTQPISNNATQALSDDENLCALAATQATIAIQSQIMFASLGQGMSNLATSAGSPRSISYMLGYCKAVHRFYEEQTNAHINDGSMNLVAISSVFSENSIEECLSAINQTYVDLENDVCGIRSAFLLGSQDYETSGDGAINGDSGLISILGVGREQ